MTKNFRNNYKTKVLNTSIYHIVKILLKIKINIEFNQIVTV